MDPLKLYGMPLSVHTRKVILAAKLKQIPYEVVPVVPVNPDSLPADWREISPAGLIPVIEEQDGFRLADSTAICLYLERRAPKAPLLPGDDREAATALFLDSWAGSHLFRDVMRPILHQEVINPTFRNLPCDPQVVRAILEDRAPDAFGYLEGRVRGPFLVGGRVTLADLAVVSNLLLFHDLGRRIDADRFPKLKAYFDHHLDAPLLLEALAAETPFAERLGFDRSYLRVPA